MEASFKAAKALPVNDPEYWAKQRKVADEDVFFQKFFTERAKRDELKGIDRTKKGDEDEALDAAEGKEINFDWESDEEEEKFVQGLAENLMKSQAHGAKIDYDDEDPDMDDWSDYDDSDEEKEDAIYTLWLTMMHTALSSIYNYSPKSSKWNQAHRYVIIMNKFKPGHRSELFQ